MTRRIEAVLLRVAWRFVYRRPVIFRSAVMAALIVCRMRVFRRVLIMPVFRISLLNT